mgnify:CR=1 FL=1
MMSEEKKLLAKISNRAYLAWLLYMVLFAAGFAVVRAVRWFFAAGIVFYTYLFFSRKERTIVELYENRVIFYKEDETVEISREDMVSFEYAGENMGALKVEYRDEDGAEKVFVMEEANMAAVHKALNQHWPEKNLVKSNYEKLLEETQQANKKYYASIGNKIRNIFKK